MKKIYAAVAAMLVLTLGACERMNPDNSGDPKKDTEDPVNPDPQPNPDPTPAECVYLVVTEDLDDWSGDYLIGYRNSNTSILLLNNVSDGKGGTEELTDVDFENGIPAELADEYRAVIEKTGGTGYSIRLYGAGYIGKVGDKDIAVSETPDESSEYQWSISCSNRQVALKAGNAAKSLQWNASASIFRFYNANGQKQITLLKRNVRSGGDDPSPSPDPVPTPDPDPTPDPNPNPDPVPTNAKYGWFELPATDYAESGKYLIDKTDNSLYFAHHLCAGGEKGPNGKTARNYTVCYSAEHHCPVWVAAPRHQMYETKGANRTDAYGKDPDIPYDIQYSSKSTGGGCNKGHMLGSRERLSSAATNRQVFYYTNIAPQYSSSFNTGGGAWNNLEDHIDGLVCADTLYEVVGCYFKQFKDAYGNIGNPATISFGSRSDVTRPSMFYYVLLRTKKGNSGKAVTSCSAGELQCVAFVMCHEMEKGHKPQAKDMMSVSDLEKLTGFTYFPNVPNAPKTSFTASDWL